MIIEFGNRFEGLGNIICFLIEHRDTLQQQCADNMPYNALLKTDLYTMSALIQQAERIADWQANVEALLTDQHISMVSTESTYTHAPICSYIL